MNKPEKIEVGKYRYREHTIQKKRSYTGCGFTYSWIIYGAEMRNDFNNTRQDAMERLDMWLDEGKR